MMTTGMRDDENGENYLTKNTLTKLALTTSLKRRKGSPFKRQKTLLHVQ